MTMRRSESIVEFSAQWNRAGQDLEDELAEDGRQLKLFDCLLAV